MDANSQTRGGRAAGRPIGAPNYNNNILIQVVELYLPQGLEAWRAVAIAYQRESMEAVLRRGEDVRDNWNKKLCNRMMKPTGKPGVNNDRIFRCIEIERRIQDEAAAAILGAESAESAHSRDEGDRALSDVEDVDQTQDRTDPPLQRPRKRSRHCHESERTPLTPHPKWPRRLHPECDAQLQCTGIYGRY